MSQLTVFNFDNYVVRVILINGEPWWVSKDVAEILDYSATSRMLPLVDEEDKKEINPQEYPALVQSLPDNSFRLSVINESGLYSCIFSSNKTEARKFKKWVTSEVLPTLRKTGTYSSQPSLAFDKAMKDLPGMIDFMVSTGIEKGMATQMIYAGLQQKFPEYNFLLEPSAKAARQAAGLPEQTVNPTSIAEIVSRLLGIPIKVTEVNKKLAELNLQYQEVTPKVNKKTGRVKNDKVWKPTEEGMQYGSFEPYVVELPNGSKRSGHQLMWKESVADHLARCWNL